MVCRISSVIAYCSRYAGVTDVEERNRLRNDLMQEIICNLIYVDGPRAWSHIATYFGTNTGGDASKTIRRNMKILTDKDWGLDPLVKVEDGRYVINDSWSPEPPIKFENGIYRYVIDESWKEFI
jgi:hypothetical protein